MTSIAKCLEAAGIEHVDTNSSYADDIQYYRGIIKKFSYYNVFNGLKNIRTKRYTLNMAKTVCEDWANLLLNERVQIACSDKNQQIVNNVFEKNEFSTEANRLIELTFALGTGAFVEYLVDDEVRIDYVTAEKIVPISVDHNVITECAFGSLKTISGKDYTYIQVHYHSPETGTYHIKNLLFDEDGKKAELALLDIEEDIDTGSASKLFQIIKPHIVNNEDINSPMGISVYANGKDAIRGVDVVFDSFVNEFVLGRKRILVPTSMAKIQLSQGGGEVVPVFDPNDTVFYAINSSNPEEKIKDMDSTIRAEEHINSINQALNLVSLKCGLGTGRYKFENNAVVTATEVISDKSDLYQNKQKHQIIISAAINALIKNIITLSDGTYADDEIKIDFDDSIIVDEAAERTQDRLDVAMGSISIYEYRAKYRGETVEEAKQRILEDKSVSPEDEIME